MTSIFRTLLGGLLFVLVLVQPTKATHIVSGELNYQSDTTTVANPLRYFFKLIVYQDGNSAADNPSATLYLGDGISVTSDRTSKVLLDNSCSLIFRNTYYFEHTFAGPGTFTAIYREINRDRSQNIVNAIDQSFIVTAQINIDVFAGRNVSPQFLPPIMPCAAFNQPFRHSLAAIDFDGDSLDYKLITPLTSNDSFENLNIRNVTGYTLPQQVSLNSRTGEFVWDHPNQLGRYSFAVRVNKYRNRHFIGSIMRDFVIIVIPAPDNLTQSFSIENRSELSITDDNQIFLTAGQPLKIKVKYQTTGRAKCLAAFSEVFKLAGATKLDTTSTANSILAELTLNPEEAWRRSQPYILVFRGTAELNEVKAQQDFTLTLIAKPELVSGDTDGGASMPEPGNNGLFVVYPNPAQTYFRVKNNQLLTRAQCRLYNALQQVILQTNLNGPDTRIKLPQIATGIYFYQILSDNGQVRQTGKLYIE